jgi:steroid delta-isomerase-like uncharacterized protein
LEGLEAWRQFTAPFVEAFPDLRPTIQDIAAEGDTVAARVAFRGTHRGEFQGLPPTGKQVAFSSMEFNRVVDGKVEEHWVEINLLGLVQQLGVANIPGPRSRGRGPVQRLLMGSVSDSVVHGASFPVLVMRGGEGAWPPQRVIVGDDGSEEAKGAGDLAARIGKLFGAKALLVRAFPQLPDMDTDGRRSNARMVEDEMRREEQAIVSRAKEIQGPLRDRPRIEIAVGDPAVVLLRAAEVDTAESTLIAVGSRGLGKAQRMRLGSASTKVLHAAEGPVLVYPRSRSYHFRGPEARRKTKQRKVT